MDDLNSKDWPPLRPQPETHQAYIDKINKEMLELAPKIQLVAAQPHNEDIWAKVGDIWYGHPVTPLILRYRALMWMAMNPPDPRGKKMHSRPGPYTVYVRRADLVDILPYGMSTVDRMITTGYRITGKMDNNPNFQDAPPELEEAKKLLPELQSSVSNAKGRDIEAVNLKNETKARFIVLLAILAQYVTEKCKGDRGMLLSSGFLISGDKSTPEEPVIQQLEVELGPPGEATTQVKRLRRARAYMHQYTTEPPTSETKWVSEGSKQPYYTFSGLNSTAKYWFRVVAISQEGQTVNSPVVTRVIQ